MALIKDAVKKEAPKKRLINILLTEEQELDIREKADKYANGNLSVWIRYASINCIPPKEDLVKEPKK